MPISREKLNELATRLERLAIRPDDLEEKFILASGKGGQKVAKTASCVQLKHLPTGIVIKCSKTRSREDNRFFARRELCDRLENKEEAKYDKIRKQKQRRKKRAKKTDSL